MSQIFVSIRAKLLGAFAVVLGLGGLGLNGTQQLIGTMHELSDELLPDAHAISALVDDVYNARTTVLSHVIAATPDGMQIQERAHAQNAEQIRTGIDTYRARATSDEERNLIDSFDKGWTAYAAGIEKVFPLSRAGQSQQAYDLINGELATLGTAVAEASQKLVDFNESESVIAKTGSDALGDTTSLLLTIAAALAFVVAVGFAIGIVRSVSRGIAAIIGPMRRLTEGDLAVEVPMQGPEIGTGPDRRCCRGV